MAVLQAVLRILLSQRSSPKVTFKGLICSGRVSHYGHHHQRYALLAGIQIHLPGQLFLEFGHLTQGKQIMVLSEDPLQQLPWLDSSSSRNKRKQHQHCDNWLLRFLRWRSRDHSKLQLRDREGNPELRPSLCLVSHPCSSQKRVWSPCQAAASASKPRRREAAQRYAGG